MTTSTPLREDLLALTAETLASLANRGLVKRAAKDLDADAGPQVSSEQDGTVVGVHPDGTRTRLPVGVGLDGAQCDCPASGVCRHRIGLVLAYQRLQALDKAKQPQDPPVTVWSPAEFDDETLEAVLGRPAVAAARRAVERGYSATVHRAEEAQPAPWVELPTCTVRFPVPHELGYALTDAAALQRGEVIALAVWAFRAADEAPNDNTALTRDTPPVSAETMVSVGGRPPTPADAVGRDSGLERLDEAVALADELLLDGVAHTSPVFAAQLERMGAALTRASLHWPASTLADLRRQIQAYAARDASYEPIQAARLLAELHARRRAGRSDRVSVLGTQEPSETPLRRVRLVALGCRITGRTPNRRSAEVYFAHPDAGIALVLRKHWEIPDDRALTGHELASRRLLGSALRDLAGSNVVSESISRSPSRSVTIGRGRIAATSIIPVGSAWADLPEPLLIRDLSTQMRAWDGRPPRLIRPRVEADTARVLAVADVGPVGYDPAQQRLEAVVRDPSGNEAVIRADYNPACPGGLDALSDALSRSRVRFVSGLLRRDGGLPLLDPLALLSDEGLTIPDLAAGDGKVALGIGTPRSSDPITQAIKSALDMLADIAHAGLRGFGEATRDGLATAARELRRTGLHAGAALLDSISTTMDAKGVEATGVAWANAAIHLLVSLELHEEARAS
ncbi:hypothetical protein [Streptacidiphilus rugosus]|uniref:hypothetical protein n=1 Tax=Streptacidiphilus rugosus TaxID=405783 RepID=UPI00056AF904|nr:hypothetical protein [Streptacidiphilus rugosus]